MCLLHKGDTKFIVQDVGQIKEARPNLLIFAIRKELIAPLELSKGYALITTSEIVKEYDKKKVSPKGIEDGLFLTGYFLKKWLYPVKNYNSAPLFDTRDRLIYYLKSNL